MSDNCKFVRSWIGTCKKPATLGEFCEEHGKLKCCSCGEKATRDCEHTGIQFVCGAPLCDSCTHGIPEPGNEGWFMLGGGHVTKEEQKRQRENRADREKQT